MPRNFDLAQLRAFVKVCDTHSITQAAHALNLTQAAVSQQIRKLEEQLGIPLFLREHRRIQTTAAAQRLLPQATQLLMLNDSIQLEFSQLQPTQQVKLGLPYDLVQPYLPTLLKALRRQHPTVQLDLQVDSSYVLKQKLQQDELELILTTEMQAATPAQCLSKLPLKWFGAEAGEAYLQRPLPLALDEKCAFRAVTLAALDHAEIAWQMENITRYDHLNSLLVSDLIVAPGLENTMPAGVICLPEASKLPVLPEFGVYLQLQADSRNTMVHEVAHLISKLFQ